jgi:tetratricopeptide (TPR) repeat protein
VDIYSLGLVLYKLLNNNRLPFLDPTTQNIQYQDRKSAIDRRLSGEALIAPINASPHLAQVILIACAFKPAERFQTPTAFKNALGAAKGEKASHVPVKHVAALTDTNATTAARRAPDAAQPVAQADVPVASFGNEKKKKSKAKKVLVTFIVILCLIGVATGAYFLNPGGIFDDMHDIVGSIVDIVDTSADVITALEEGNFEEALSLALEADKDSLQRRLEERLGVLDTEFRAESIDFVAVTMELDTISKMSIPGLSGILTQTRDKIAVLNASRTAFSTAETLYSQGNYVEAMAQYRLVVNDDSNYTRAIEGLSNAVNAHRSVVLTDADRYADQGNYASAMQVLNNGLRVIENDAELTQSLTLMQQSYVSSTISQADTLVAEGRYDDAISLIGSTLHAIPGDEQLTRRRDEIAAAKPVNLSTIVVVDSRHYKHSNEVFTDSFGNRYRESFELRPSTNSPSWQAASSEFSESDRAAYVVFNFNGDYKAFSADIVAPTGLESSAEFEIEVFFEEDLNPTPVVTIRSFTVRTGATPLQIDVSGVITMTIIVRVRDSIRSSNHHSIHLVDATLSR